LYGRRFDNGKCNTRFDSRLARKKRQEKVGIVFEYLSYIIRTDNGICRKQGCVTRRNPEIWLDDVIVDGWRRRADGTFEKVKEVEEFKEVEENEQNLDGSKEDS
jgi:hypothetical protein